MPYGLFLGLEGAMSRWWVCWKPLDPETSPVPVHSPSSDEGNGPLCPHKKSPSKIPSQHHLWVYEWSFHSFVCRPAPPLPPEWNVSTYRSSIWSTMERRPACVERCPILLDAC